MRVAFITGITGQDGSYLAELLLEKGYKVHGLFRRVSQNNSFANIGHLIHKPNLILHNGDITDFSSLLNIIRKIESTFDTNTERFEIYNLAAQSHVQRSFDIPGYTLESDGMGPLYILEAIRTSNYKDIIRFYQASTSEMYGKIQEYPQTETTPFYPRSPYGVAKLYAYWIVKNYRESYNIYASNGILFNHESPRRGKDFVTRKITSTLKKILSGEQSYIELGNLDSKRDWGHAKDYVEGMWRMLQNDTADDFVLATNETHSIKEFVEIAFSMKNIDISWIGQSDKEEGYDQHGVLRVKVNPAFYRPSEVDILCGNSSKAEKILGWKRNYTFNQLVREMVREDCDIS